MSSLDFSSLPEEFRIRLERIIPAENWETVKHSFSIEKEVSFRCNTLKGTAKQSTEELRDSGIEFHQIPWYPNAFVSPCSFRPQLTRHPLFEDGSIYIHNISSIAAVWALDPKPEETVLDLAAAPGGKTLQIAAQMKGTGQLSAVEVVKNRFFKLKQNLRNGNASYVKTFCTDGRQVGIKTGERFDRVLLDAPCSGEARFHCEEPETFEFWSAKKISDCKRKQQGLIKSAFRALKPGGIMLYSTCSFAPEENEGTVAYLLKKFPEAEILPIDLPFDHWQAGIKKWEKKAYPDSVSLSRRILPNKQMNGLYLCRIQKPLKEKSG